MGREGLVMSIAVLIKQLRDAGAPMEAIEIAVSAVEAERAKFEAAEATRLAAEEARKSNQRERTAKSRAKSRDGNVTVTAPPRDPSPKDNNQTPTQPIPPVDPDGSTAPKGADDAELPGLVDPIEAGAAPAALSNAEQPKAKPEARARRIPADFADSPEARAVCAEMGLNRVEADAALAEFCDFWLSEGGAKARKLDWPRTLRNRLREVGRRRPAARAAPANRRSGNGYFDLLREELGSPDDRYADQDYQHLRLASGGRH